MSADLLVINGPGVVARRGEAVLWAESTDLRREGLLAAIIEAMDAAATAHRSPADFAGWLIGELAGPSGVTVPALAFAVPDGDELLTVVHGWGRVATSGGVVSVTGSPIRIPARLPAAVGRADLAVPVTGDSLLRLVEGAVPGGAALLLPSTAPQPSAAPPPLPVAAAGPAAAPVPVPAAAPVPVPAAAPVPTSEPPPLPATSGAVGGAPVAVASGPPPLPGTSGGARAGGGEHGDLLDDVSTEVTAAPGGARSDGAGEHEDLLDDVSTEVTAAPGADGPRRAIVAGLRCAEGHFNRPGAQYCRTCGVALIDDRPHRADDQRPVLGALVCDDGTRKDLDGDYAIGSDPRDEPGVLSGLARPLVFGSAADGVAPTHVIVHLDGWDVHVLNRTPDRSAAVLNRGDTSWTPIPPGQWARLGPGGYVGFAGRHVVYESAEKDQPR